MPYRDDQQALRMRVEGLLSEIDDRDRTIEDLESQLANAHRGHQRAMAVLRMIADQHKLREALDAATATEADALLSAKSMVPPTAKESAESEPAKAPQKPSTAYRTVGPTDALS